jgi:acetylglutamate kinase
MRFETDEKVKLLELLQSHPVVVHGGTVELCEMPRS